MKLLDFMKHPSKEIPKALQQGSLQSPRDFEKAPSASQSAQASSFVELLSKGLP